MSYFFSFIFIHNTQRWIRLLTFAKRVPVPLLWAFLADCLNSGSCCLSSYFILLKVLRGSDEESDIKCIFMKSYRPFIDLCVKWANSYLSYIRSALHFEFVDSRLFIVRMNTTAPSMQQKNELEENEPVFIAWTVIYKRIAFFWRIVWV